MSIQLEKGSSINLSKSNPDLETARIRLEWDPVGGEKGFLGSLFGYSSSSEEYDLDAFVNVLTESGSKEKIYYGRLENSNSSIVHAGDDLTGAGEGEEIRVDLTKLEANVSKLDIFTDIYNARSKGQTFGKVKNAKLGLYNDKTGDLICEYKLGDEFSNDTGVHFGSLEKVNNEWQFIAIGKGI